MLDATAQCTRRSPPPLHLLIVALQVFLVNYTALCMYPALQARYRPPGWRRLPALFAHSLSFLLKKRVESVDHVLPERFFTPVTTFLLFNLMALIGNLLTTNGLPIPGPKRLWIPVCLRFLLLPAMLFCNYRPSTRVLPVLIRSDWLYSLLSALQGLSNGYLLSLAVMYAPKMVSKQDSPTVGMMIGVTGQSDEESLLFTMKRGSAVRHGFHRLGSHDNLPLATDRRLITEACGDSILERRRHP